MNTTDIACNLGYDSMCGVALVVVLILGIPIFCSLCFVCCCQNEECQPELYIFKTKQHSPTIVEIPTAELV